jgi:hypothetical protein
VNAYFGPLKTVEDVSPEEITFERESGRKRLAGRVEMTHLVYIASSDWHRLWSSSSGTLCKESQMNTLFFHYFKINTGGAVAAEMYALTFLPPLVTIYRHLYRGRESWPFKLITKRINTRNQDEYRTYGPRSDFVILKSKFPRLLIEVNSRPKQYRPEDLVRMLVTGTVLVRFANRFLDRFNTKKNFVLFAFYIWDNGEVTRYSLFQEPDEVCTLYI